MRKRKLSAVIMAAVLACSLMAAPAGQSSAAGKVKLNKTKVTLTVGKSTKLKLKNAPKGKKISWKSSKKSVATVSSKGVVKAKKKGTAMITARVAGKKYTCKVTVKAKTSSYTPYTPYVPTPTPTTQAPAPTTQAPVPTTQAPAPTTQAPAPTTQAPAPTTQAPAPTTQAPAPTTQATEPTTPTTQKPEQGSTQDEKPTPGQEVKLTNTEGKDEKEVAALEKLIGKLVADGATVSTDLDSSDYSWSDGKIDSIYWFDKNIKGELSFEGLDSLDYLNCGYNQISRLDVSKNTALASMRCYGNQLTELDVSKNSALKELDCLDNQLTKLDVSNNIALTSLTCSSNQLTELDVSNNSALKSLICSYNQLTKLDVSKNAKLEDLTCNDNQLSELDLSKNFELEYLSCESNQLKTLDLSNNTELKSLYCWSNQLTELDLSNNRKVESFIYDDDDVTVTGYEAKSGEEPTTEEKGSDATTEETPTEEKTESPKPTEEVTEDAGAATEEKTEAPGTTEQGTTEEGSTSGGKEPEEDDTSEQSIIVGQVTAAPGDENVSVDIIVKNNPGILGMMLTIGYDDTVLNLTDAQGGEALSVLTFAKGGILKNGCNFTWDGEKIESEQVKDGTILTLTFSIPSDAPKGTYPISFAYRDGDICNNDLEDLSFKITNGAITVE